MKTYSIGPTLFTPDKIERRVQELADEISNEYEDGLIAVVVMTGAMFFASDLMRAMSILSEPAPLSLGSYGDGTKSGIVRLNSDITIDITGKDVLIVEDIVDTGRTMEYIQMLFGLRKPKSLKLCSLLSNESRRKATVKIDYLGFEVEEFVIGYGFDVGNKFRTLSYIATAIENR